MQRLFSRMLSVRISPESKAFLTSKQFGVTMILGGVGFHTAYSVARYQYSLMSTMKEDIEEQIRIKCTRINERLDAIEDQMLKSDKHERSN